MTALLEVDDVTVRFGGLTALSSVTFVVSQHELVGVIGPNGAGKTTLFNCLSGLVRPTLGRLRFNGRSLSGLSIASIARAGLARTFQLGRVFPAMTVADNLRFALEGVADEGAVSTLVKSLWPGKRHNREEVDEFALRYRLAPVLAAKASDLTFQQQGRLGIAMAMATRPKMLLLDEPLAGLNHEEARDALRLIDELRADGTTVVLIEHNMGAVMSTCERLIVLRFGEVLADGPTDDVRRDPEVVRTYLGEAT